MSGTIIYGLFFVTFSLPGNKALNKDKLLKGCSRSLLITRALLLLLNRLPNSNIRAFSLSSFHFIIVCWTWQGAIHHCCSEVWRAATVRVLLCKSCTNTSSCSEGPRANRQQRDVSAVGTETKIEDRFPYWPGTLWVLVGCQIPCCPISLEAVLQESWICSAQCAWLFPSQFFSQGLASAGSELTSLLFPCSSYFYLVPCTEPLWCWEGSSQE